MLLSKFIVILQFFRLCPFALVYRLIISEDYLAKGEIRKYKRKNSRCITCRTKGIWESCGTELMALDTLCLADIVEAL